MWYELWDSETGNRVGTYPTEQDALRALLDDIERLGHSSEDILSLGLLQRDPLGQQDHLIAEGAALVQQALALVGV